MKINLIKGPKDGVQYDVDLQEEDKAALPDGMYFISYDAQNREVESRYYMSYSEKNVAGDREFFYIYEGQVVVCHE